MSINFGGYTDADFAEDEASDAKMDRAWERHKADFGECACGEPAYIQDWAGIELPPGVREGQMCDNRPIVWQRGDRACGNPICAACAAKQQVKIISPGGTAEHWETYCRECYDEHQAALEDQT